MSTIREKEAFCENSFLSSGPYWHLYTSGKQTKLVFRNDEDYAFGMNAIAQTSLEYSSVQILSFAIMSNHLHIVAGGLASDLVAWFKYFRKKLAGGLSSDLDNGNHLPDDFQEEHKGLTDLNSLRNAIAYVNRNGYVADPSCTPFSHPWSTCSYYFCLRNPHHCFKELNTATKRNMFRGRVPQFKDNTKVLFCGDIVSPLGCYIAPSSYCAIKFGMAMFRDAHHYFWAVSKNVEAYSGVATEIGDEEFLTDSELYSQLSKILREQYKGVALRNITKAQKLDLARSLRFEFRSSNAQIRRILGLTQYEIDSIFPLSARK